MLIGQGQWKIEDELQDIVQRFGILLSLGEARNNNLL